MRRAATGSARLVRDGVEIEPGDLVAETAPVDPARIPTLREVARRSGRVIEHDSLAVLAIFEAARIELPGGLADKDAAHDALGILRAIPVTGGVPGARGPIALGALPFSGASPGFLVVPGVAVLLAPGEDPLATAVGPPEEVAVLRGRFPFTDIGPPEFGDEVAPDRFSLVSVRPHEDYRSRVRDAVGAIGRGELAKVVLAREVTVEANRDFPRAALVARLRQLHPSCATYAVDGFVGASPELLLRKTGSALVSQPLAGTIGRSGDPDEDGRLARALLASDKDRAEHRFVVDAIVAGLARLGAGVAPVGEPHLLELRNVVHLATRLEASIPLDDEGDGPGALDVVAGLHPTPAVGGVPRDAALEYLVREEDLDRALYAGPVGWFDRNGDGEFYIGIRCAMIDGPRARLIAGAGIVEGSDPDLELAETQLKLQALLAAAVRP